MQVHKSNAYNQNLHRIKQKKKLKSSGFRKKWCRLCIQSAPFPPSVIDVVILLFTSQFSHSFVSHSHFAAFPNFHFFEGQHPWWCPSRKLSFLKVSCTSQSPKPSRSSTDTDSFWQITLECWPLELMAIEQLFCLQHLIHRFCAYFIEQDGAERMLIRLSSCLVLYMDVQLETDQLVPTWLARPVSTKWQWSFGSLVRSTVAAGKNVKLHSFTTVIWRECGNDSSSMQIILGVFPRATVIIRTL